MTPQTTADLSDIMRAAEAPLRIVGGDSRGIAPEAGATLQTTGLAGIKAYQPGALTMVAGAGTSLQEVEDTLAAQGQRLAFEPMRYHKILGGQKSSTIGGCSRPISVGRGVFRRARRGIFCWASNA